MPINFKSSIIVKISFTKGTLDRRMFLPKIDAAKIGNEAFFEPEMAIVPDKSFFPLIKSFCIRKIYTLGSVTPFCFIYFPFLFAYVTSGFSFPLININ